MINIAYHRTKKSDLLKFLHVADFIPVKLTWIILTQKVYFQLWPRLTVQLVTKYISNSVATARGQIYQVRKYIWSTNPIYKGDSEDTSIKKLEIPLTCCLRE